MGPARKGPGRVGRVVSGGSGGRYRSDEWSSFCRKPARAASAGGPRLSRFSRDPGRRRGRVLGSAPAGGSRELRPPPGRARGLRRLPDGDLRHLLQGPHDRPDGRDQRGRAHEGGQPEQGHDRPLPEQPRRRREAENERPPDLRPGDRPQPPGRHHAGRGCRRGELQPPAPFQPEHHPERQHRPPDASEVPRPREHRRLHEGDRGPRPLPGRGEPHDRPGHGHLPRGRARLRPGEPRPGRAPARRPREHHLGLRAPRDAPARGEGRPQGGGQGAGPERRGHRLRPVPLHPGRALRGDFRRGRGLPPHLRHLPQGLRLPGGSRGRRGPRQGPGLGVGRT